MSSLVMRRSTGPTAVPRPGQVADQIEFELLRDLEPLGERLADDAFCADLYRALGVFRVISQDRISRAGDCRFRGRFLSRWTAVSFSRTSWISAGRDPSLQLMRTVMTAAVFDGPSGAYLRTGRR